MTYTSRFRSHLASIIKRIVLPPILNVHELVIGKNVVIQPGVEINCDRLALGDGVIIKSGTRIDMVDLVIGDYTTINNHCFLSGTDWCRIGRNCWIGHYSIIDSIGTTNIGNGVGLGGHSQLWTHAYFGDVMQGCRFASHKRLVIEDDVWFVGHCIVSPIHAYSRSMAMVGSVVTKDMFENRVYAGVPAVDMTDKIGHQFESLSLDKKMAKLSRHLNDFLADNKPRENRIRIVEKLDMKKREFSQFSPSERMYIKNLYPEEVQFMRYLLPYKAKFLPNPQTDWIAPYLASRS